MQVINGKEKEVVGMLNSYGLCDYEAKMYFTLLTIGEAKVLEITRKASIPQSKAYTILDTLGLNQEYLYWTKNPGTNLKRWVKG